MHRRRPGPRRGLRAGHRVSAVAVRHVVTGPEDAPVVVLSNSLGSTTAMWDAQVAALAEHFRVVRYDTRGHGRLARPRRALRHRRPGRRRGRPARHPRGPAGALRRPLTRRHDRHAAGGPQSRAGRPAGRALHLRPARPRRSAWHDRAATVRDARHRGRGRGRRGALVHRAPTRRREPATSPPARRWSPATPAEGYASCCEVIAAMDLAPTLPTISAPTLAIAGADDPATPPPHLEHIADGVAGRTAAGGPRGGAPRQRRAAGRRITPADHRPPHGQERHEYRQGGPTAAEAVADIAHGSSLAVGGFGLVRHPLDPDRRPARAGRRRPDRRVQQLRRRRGRSRPAPRARAGSAA